jgi:nucleoside-diphosphate-sugar epimerase
MKIAVTGASGFIGKYELAVLSDCPVKIVALTCDAGKLAGVDAAICVFEMDMAEVTEGSFVQMGHPDVLIHLAWDGLPNYKSLHHFETELPKQYRFLKTLINAGLPSLIVTGTCFEYGMQSGLLMADMATNPTNPYGFAKNALRQQLMFLQAEKPFNLTWGRLFYMYGENQPSPSLYPQLKAAVLHGNGVFNMSGGEQLRDYLPAEQVASQIVRLTMPAQNLGAINICSGQPISVRRLVEQWLQNNNWKIDLNLGYYPYPDYEPMAFWGKSFFDNIQ